MKPKITFSEIVGGGSKSTFTTDGHRWLCQIQTGDLLLHGQTDKASGTGKTMAEALLNAARIWHGVELTRGERT